MPLSTNTNSWGSSARRFRTGQCRLLDRSRLSRRRCLSASFVRVSRCGHKARVSCGAPTVRSQPTNPPENELLGRSSEALEQACAVLTLDPSNFGAYMNVGSSTGAKKDYPEAPSLGVLNWFQKLTEDFYQRVLGLSVRWRGSTASGEPAAHIRDDCCYWLVEVEDRNAEPELRRTCARP